MNFASFGTGLAMLSDIPIPWVYAGLSQVHGFPQRALCVLTCLVQPSAEVFRLRIARSGIFGACGSMNVLVGLCAGRGTWAAVA